jgi:hypothetical protein
MILSTIRRWSTKYRGTGANHLGTIGHLDAFDFSEASLAIAREKAAANSLKINFYLDDINFSTSPTARPDYGGIHVGQRRIGSGPIVADPAAGIRLLRSRTLPVLWWHCTPSL